MTTKVTLSSPPVQHQLLDEQSPVDAHHHQHEQQQQQQDHHYAQTEEAHSGFSAKRPPTPPKTKHQVPSWKQHRLASQTKDVNNVNSYYPDSPDQSQSTTTTPKQKKGATNKASNAYDYDYQQYLYHQQALMAESNKKGQGQQPPPSLKKHKDQLSELFMVQEQLDQASRERDRVLEENTQLKYHLQVLQFRMQNVEYMWQSYNAAAQMWEDNNSKRQQQKQQYHYPYDQFGPPLSFPPPLDFISLSNRSLPEQQRHQHSDDGFRGRQRFRRYRSKSLPRNTSRSDINDTPYSLHPSMMIPPPPMFSSMMTKLPIPSQMFDRPPPPPFGPRMHNDPLLDTNNNDDDDSESDDMDGMNTIRQRRQQIYNDSGFMTDGPLPPSSMFPPPNTSFYPMYRYHQQQNSSNRNLPMGPPPFGHQPAYYPGDDKEDKWDQRSIILPPPPIDRPPFDYSSRPTRLNIYPREETMSNNNPNHLQQHHLQQPWMTSDHSIKLGPDAKQSISYGDPLQQQQQQQQSFYSPRHRRAHPHGTMNG